MKKLLSLLVTIVTIFAAFGFTATWVNAAKWGVTTGGNACEAHLDNLFRKYQHNAEMYFDGKITIQEFFERAWENYAKYKKHC